MCCQVVNSSNLEQSGVFSRVKLTLPWYRPLLARRYTASTLAAKILINRALFGKALSTLLRLCCCQVVNSTASTLCCEVVNSTASTLSVNHVTSSLNRPSSGKALSTLLRLRAVKSSSQATENNWCFQSSQANVTLVQTAACTSVHRFDSSCKDFNQLSFEGSIHTASNLCYQADNSTSSLSIKSRYVINSLNFIGKLYLHYINFELSTDQAVQISN